MRRRRSPNGFTLVEIMVGVLITALAIGIPVTVIKTGGGGLSRASAAIRATADVDQLATQLKNSAHTAVAVYTPASCGGVGSGDGTPCSQVRFYGKDSLGVSHYWGWEYSGGSVQQCLAYTNPEDILCATPGASVPMASFSATPTEPSKLSLAIQIDPAAAIDFATTEYKVLGTTADPNQRVVAGNRVMVMNLGNSYVVREVHLIQGGAPFTASVLKGAFQAPKIGNITLVAATVSMKMGDTPQSVTAAEVSYSTYQAYASAPYWSVSSCTSAGKTIATVTPSGLGTGDTDTFKVAPVAVGTCTYTVTTFDQQITGTVNVAAAPTCPAGDTGTYPACVAPTTPPTCPAGDTGTYPACVAPTPTPNCPAGDTGTYPACVAPTTRPTTAPTAAPTARPTLAPTAAPTAAPTVAPTAAPELPCLGSGTLTFNMPATGGTCTVNGVATMNASAAVYVNRAITNDDAEETGTDTVFGPFTLSEIEHVTQGGESDNYSGWYCYASGNYAGSAGCKNVTVKFAALPSAANPVRVTYAFSQYTETTSSRPCTNSGAAVDFHTAETQNEIKTYARTGTAVPGTYDAYQSNLFGRGYEAPYAGIDPASKFFVITEIPETNLASGQICTSNLRYDWRITVTQGAGVVGGVYTTQPGNMTVLKQSRFPF